MIEEKIRELKEKLSAQAGLVERMVAKSMEALLEKRENLIKEVIEKDEEMVNETEIEIEDFSLTLLARYQPQASNLRTITAIIKINNDLERIGDHAVNIAESARFLISKPKVKPLIDLPRMAEIVREMLKDSLDSFANGNDELAVNVCRRDDEVDGLLDQITRELLTYMMGDPSTIERALKLILIAKNLERIADLTTNIAEEVIFMAKGKVIRHHREE